MYLKFEKWKLAMQNYTLQAVLVKSLVESNEIAYAVGRILHFYKSVCKKSVTLFWQTFRIQGQSGKYL